MNWLKEITRMLNSKESKFLPQFLWCRDGDPLLLSILVITFSQILGVMEICAFLPILIACGF